MGSPGRGALAPHPAGAARRRAGVAPARAPPLWHASPAAFRPGAFRATGPGPCSSTNPAPRREKKKYGPRTNSSVGAPGEQTSPQQGWAGGRGVSTPGARFPGVVSCICQDAGANAGKAPPGPAPRGPSRFGANLQFLGARPATASMGPSRPQVSAARGGGLPAGFAARLRIAAARCWQRAGGRLAVALSRGPAASHGRGTPGCGEAGGVGRGECLGWGSPGTPAERRGGSPATRTGSPGSPAPPRCWDSRCPARGGALARLTGTGTGTGGRLRSRARRGAGGPAPAPPPQRPSLLLLAWRLPRAPLRGRARGRPLGGGARGAAAGRWGGGEVPQGRGEGGPAVRAWSPRSRGSGAEGVAVGRGGGRPRRSGRRGERPWLA